MSVHIRACTRVSVQAASCQPTCLRVSVCAVPVEGRGCVFPHTCQGQTCGLSRVRVRSLSPRVCRALDHGAALPSPLSAETDESSHFVIGAVLYRTLGLILPPPR